MLRKGLVLDLSVAFGQYLDHPYLVLSSYAVGSGASSTARRSTENNGSYG
jgi:hypothetical protein